MKFFTYFFILINLISCASIKKIEPQEASSVLRFNFLLKEFTLSPGMATLLKFEVPSDFSDLKLYCDSEDTSLQKIELSLLGNEAFTYISASYFSPLKDFVCSIKYQDEEIEVAKIKMEAYPYPSEKLNVAKSKIVLSKKDQERVNREWLITSKIYKDYIKTPLFREPFAVPLDSFRTSIYGTKRVFNNQKITQHLGNDFRAKIGTKIPASNRGKVVFTGDLFYTGTVVIIDHGLGIFTNYAHLSKILVKTGDIISKGDIVGLSGNTGRVTGPHLHWGVKVLGNYIDGFSLVRASEKQF